MMDWQMDAWMDGWPDGWMDIGQTDGYWISRQMDKEMKG